MISAREIWVTFQLEGMHRYPEAATDPLLADVAFLAHPHRHMFHFKVWIEVFENNRDIEFIQFKRWLLSLYQDGIINFNYKSCEMMAEDLIVAIRQKYTDRDITVSVSEDDENGAVLYFDKDY